MPDIIINPGSFNPPASPAQNYGFYLFPKTVMEKPKRAPMQWHSRPADDTPPVPALQDNVIGTTYYYHSGNAFVRTTKMSAEASNFPITLIGTRYVPAGSYALGTGSNYYSTETMFEFTTAPVGNTPGSFVLGNFALNPYKRADRTTSGAEYSLSVRLALAITLLGADDGANYEVGSRMNTEFYPQNGLNPVLETQLFYRDTEFAYSEAISQEREILITLTRDGLVIDQIGVTVRFIANVSVGGYQSATVGGSGNYAPNQSLPDTLYGPTLEVGSVPATTAPHIEYVRRSFNIGKGVLISTTTPP